MNLDEIRAMNPNEARKLPIEELVKAIYEGQTYSDVNLVKDKYGNNVGLTEVTRDSLTGNLVSNKVVTWDYYDDEKGIVKDIAIQVGNRKQVITHTLDGKQPMMREFIVIEETIGDKVFGAAAGGVTGAASGTKGLIVRAKDAIVGLFRV